MIIVPINTSTAGKRDVYYLMRCSTGMKELVRIHYAGSKMALLTFKREYQVGMGIKVGKNGANCGKNGGQVKGRWRGGGGRAVED